MHTDTHIHVGYVWINSYNVTGVQFTRCSIDLAYRDNIALLFSTSLSNNDSVSKLYQFLFVSSSVCSLEGIIIISRVGVTTEGKITMDMEMVVEHLQTVMATMSSTASKL